MICWKFYLLNIDISDHIIVVVLWGHFSSASLHKYNLRTAKPSTPRARSITAANRPEPYFWNNPRTLKVIEQKRPSSQFPSMGFTSVINSEYTFATYSTAIFINFDLQTISVGIDWQSEIASITHQKPWKCFESPNVYPSPDETLSYSDICPGIGLVSQQIVTTIIIVNKCVWRVNPASCSEALLTWWGGAKILGPLAFSWWVFNLALNEFINRSESSWWCSSQPGCCDWKGSITIISFPVS